MKYPREERLKRLVFSLSSSLCGRRVDDFQRRVLCEMLQRRLTHHGTTPLFADFTQLFKEKRAKISDLPILLFQRHDLACWHEAFQKNRQQSEVRIILIHGIDYLFAGSIYVPVTRRLSPRRNGSLIELSLLV